MAEKIRYLSDLELHGNMAFALPVTEFPQSASIGTMILKDTVLYCYLKIGDLETWFPFAKGTNSYVHTQGVASQTWTVNHNLGTASIWYQVRDENGAIQQVGKTDVSANTFTLNFTCPMLGTVVVVAPDSINVPEVKASSISISNNVIIDSSGVRVNGNYVLTSANITSQIATAVASETDRAVTAETSLSTATAAVATNLTSERNRALTAESNLSTDISTHAGDSSIHTTMEQVNSAIQGIVGAAPAALDTLKEIADQLANDENAVAALTTIISGKATKATTLSGYDIADAYTKSEMDTSLALKTNDSSLASIAKSGSYNDLTNKPTIPVVPTNVSAFTNDSNYQTASDITASIVNKADKGTTLASYGITDGLTLGDVVGTSDGTASAGTATTAARSDHVHPTDITREPAIVAGTTAQYFRGDKTWATMPVVVNTTANNLYAGATQLAITATGGTNIAIGSDFLAGSSTGTDNVAIGNKAISTNTSGTYNTAIGSSALKNNTMGNNNVSIGYNAMASNTSGGSNVAIGVNAFVSGPNVNNVVAIGATAMRYATTNRATAVGYSALQANNGAGNTAIGFYSSYYNTSGSQNTSVGEQSLYNNTTGNGNIALGMTTLFNNTTGSFNTAINYNALRSNTTGSMNTASGFQALFFNTTGSNNTVYGASAGQNITYGFNNTIIGANYTGTAGLANNVVLATGDGTARAIFNGTDWTMTGIVNATSFNSTSDFRLKDNITTITNGLEVVKAINPVSFNLKETGDKSYGVIAQEIEAIIADGVVTEREDGYKAVNYSTLIPFLVDAVKTLSTKVDELQSKLDSI